MLNNIILPLYDKSIPWQMDAAERMALNYVFSRMLEKEKAIEVGSYYGGCTRLLANNFNRIISVDTDHSLIVNKLEYTNAIWYTGDSKKILSTILLEHRDANFIIIDGDHSYDGVYSDLITCIMHDLPTKPIIMLHDAAYEPSREAIIDATKQLGDSYFVDVNFVPGVPFKKGFIGGFALVAKK